MRWQVHCRHKSINKADSFSLCNELQRCEQLVTSWHCSLLYFYLLQGNDLNISRVLDVILTRFHCSSPLGLRAGTAH